MTKMQFTSSLVFFCCALNACAKAENPATVGQTAKIDQHLFSTRTPISNEIKFDIDGDGKADSAEWATISKNAQSLPQGITLASPWELNDGSGVKSHPLHGGSQNNVLVTLGNAKQFLIHDVNDVSLLDTDAAQEISILLKPSLVELELPELSEQTKGDVIVIPTEAGIDTYLFWNGSTFQAYEPMELP